MNHDYVITYATKTNGSRIPHARITNAENAETAKRLTTGNYIPGYSSFPFYVKTERLPKAKGVQNSWDLFLLSKERPSRSGYCVSIVRNDLGFQVIRYSEETGERDNCAKLDWCSYARVEIAYAITRFWLEDHPLDGFRA